jgi:Zn-dependent peptidase ImmA (M78 family)
MVEPLKVFAEQYGVSSPEQAMRLACAQVRSECGETQAPIALTSILNRFRARVRFQSMSVAGRLELARDGFDILVNRSGSWRRHRFTIAHELGHIIVLRAVRSERTIVRALRKPTPALWARLERLCNLAAAELLMPATEFLNAYRKYSFCADGLRFLYDEFLTSFSAILVRVADLGTGQATLVWKRAARNEREARALRITACYTASQGVWLPRGLTSRHLVPDLAVAAEERTSDVYGEVEIEFAKTLERFRTVVVPLAAVRHSCRDQLPIFHGHRVPDEGQLSSALAMLLHGESERTQRARRVANNFDFDRDLFVAPA